MCCFSHIEDCLSSLLTLGQSDRGQAQTINIGPDDEFVSISRLFRSLKGIGGFEG